MEGQQPLFPYIWHLPGGWLRGKLSVISVLVDSSGQRPPPGGPEAWASFTLTVRAKQCSQYEQATVTSSVDQPWLYLTLSLGFLNRENSRTLMHS